MYDETHQIFIESCQEHLDKVEEAILDMEKDGSISLYYDAIFRGIHTLKGDAKSYGSITGEKIAHDFEDKLVALKKRGAKMEKADIDDLLHRLDTLRNRLMVEG